MIIISTRKRRPGTTVGARENQMISLAMDCAEERIRSGKASDSLLVHYLKLGSKRAQLEQEKLENENELLRAKTSAIESSRESSEKYEEAIRAFKSYSIDVGDEEDDEDW